MGKPLIVEFTKMDGAGNDFIVLDNRFYSFSGPELAGLALRLCNRYTGIGGDGLLALCPPDESDHSFRMRYHNADGTLGTMCGNGARCLAAFAYESGIRGEVLVFGSDAGEMRARLTGEPAGADGLDVEIVLPQPQRFSTEAPPVPGGSEGISPVGFVWTGTEHVVYEAGSLLAELDVSTVGSLIRNHPELRPTGANVNFVRRAPVTDDHHPHVVARTYEKGVEAETRACGTGAVAIAFCGRERGWWDSGTIRVEMPGGTLRVGLPLSRDGSSGVTLSGPARVAFHGSVEVDPNELTQE